MIPVRLTIQGLYSYQERQTIDFTRLTAARLFGIFGPVGSGKSSILEAITFALYGRTDRLNLSGDNRNYNMMNLKSNELLIDFVFETGPEQTAYRAVVRGKRNTRRYEDVKTLDRTAYMSREGQWVPMDPAALEQAIGLSYDNFKRTVIIPQGQFQEFLQLGDKDRTQMMKDLFNLGKYEFFYKISSLEGKNTAELQRVEGRLLQLGTVEPEQKNVYEDLLLQAKQAVEELSEQLTSLRKAEEQLRQISDLSHKLTEAGKTLAALREQETAYRFRAERLAKYETCINQFKPLLDSIKNLEEKQSVRAAVIRQDEQALEQETKAVAGLSQWIQEHKAGYENRTEQRKKAEELGRLVGIRKLEHTIAEETERLNKGTAVLERTEKESKDLQNNLGQLEADIKALRAQQPNLERLSEIRAWHVQHRSIETQITAARADIAQWDAEAGQLTEQIQELLKSPVFRAFPVSAAPFSSSDFSSAMAFLDKRTETIRQEQERLRNDRENLFVKTGLAQHAVTLEEGTPCPLCGALHHPAPFKSSDLKDAQEQIDKKHRSFEEELKQIRLSENRLNEYTIKAEQWEQRKNILLRQLDRHLQTRTDHLSRFVWESCRQEEELNGAFKEVKRLQRIISEKETARETANASLAKTEKDKNRYRQELHRIHTEKTIHETERETLLAQLQYVRPGDYERTDTLAIEKEKIRLLEETSGLEKVFIEKSEQLTARTQKQSVLNGSLEARRKEQAQEAIEWDREKKKLSGKIPEWSFRTQEEIEDILKEPIDIVAERALQARYQESLMGSRQQVEQLRKELGTRKYNPEAHRILQTQIRDFGELMDKKNQEIGTVQKNLDELVQKLKDRDDLEKERDKLGLRAENIKTLKGLFKASGFVNYISTVYLQHLCRAANERFFQLTRQKLRLELTDGNNFEVRDFMNGGKTRSVKTLSGGQTFQAALSLALALADNIQQITASNQNFFFLDEGFGSLDKESLTVVFDTLKSLRKETRIVGIISHVEEMQQEIDVHLRIENDEERGSLIRASWAT